MFNFIFPCAVDFTNENIIGFITEHVLTLSHFSLPLSIYDIFVNRVDDVRRNKIEYFTFVSIEIWI